VARTLPPTHAASGGWRGARVQVVVSGSGAELTSDWRFEGGLEQWVVGCACGTRDDDGERMVRIASPSPCSESGWADPYF
jgi:hypothetical protein